MSGFTDKGRFELTNTRAKHWHGQRRCCRSLGDIARTHLVPAGFAWYFGTGGNFIVVMGPGIADESAKDLYQAVSGKVSL